MKKYVLLIIKNAQLGFIIGMQGKFNTRETINIIIYIKF